VREWADGERHEPRHDDDEEPGRGRESWAFDGHDERDGEGNQVCGGADEQGKGDEKEHHQPAARSGITKARDRRIEQPCSIAGDARAEHVDNEEEPK